MGAADSKLSFLEEDAFCSILLLQFNCYKAASNESFFFLVVQRQTALFVQIILSLQLLIIPNKSFLPSLYGLRHPHNHLYLDSYCLGLGSADVMLKHQILQGEENTINNSAYGLLPLHVGWD